MQLMIISLSLFFLFLAQDIKAQIQNISLFSQKKTKGLQTEMDSTIYDAEPSKDIELDLLSSYYVQDGNNAAVTGGIGTEFLTDYTSKIILKIPIKQKLELNLDAGFDYYSSASTDNIDNIVSSASSSDRRSHGNVGFSYQITPEQSFGMRVGGSGEYDYTSFNVGMNYGLLSKDKNTNIGLNLQAFIDRWSLYYPSELRGQGNLVPTNLRQSYNGSLTIGRVLNQRMQFSLQLEAVYMNGLLSTPFHRVFFKEQSIAKLEQLPDKRLKVPIGLRFNIHATDFLLTKFYYRYYWDDWGVKAHTASLELPIKINRFFSVYPFYRYHTQTAANYFQAYKEHSFNQEFYTSDYDLSALNSQTFGLGLRYAPVNGLARMKIPFKKKGILMVKSLDLKYSHYRRSTRLNANIVSLGLSFNIK